MLDAVEVINAATALFIRHLWNLVASDSSNTLCYSSLGVDCH